MKVTPQRPALRASPAPQPPPPVVTRTPPPPARADLFDAQPGTTAGVATPATSPARSFFEQASIVVRTLPPLDQVLADAQVAPLDPATIPVPEDVLRTLEKAKRVLVVSHTPPDGDALGSCLGLRRALEALGKTADVCIDDDLPGSIRSLAQPGEVKRAAALAGQTYDAVVLVDIAIHKRVGGARALLEQTRNIVVLDHHHRDPLPSGFNLQPGVTIQNWVEPSADAACLMASAVCAHLATRAGHVVGQGPFAGVETPLIAGTLTDTQDFQVSGLEMESMRVLKHLVGAPGIVDIADVRAKLTYQLPACARGLLAVPPRYQGALATAAGADIVRRFEALPPEQRLRVETTAGTALLTCPRAVIDLAVEAARLEAPETTPNDVTGELQDQLDGLARTHDAAVLLYGARETVKASFRSKPVGLALQMARALGGGGHDCAAGATVESGLVGDVATTTRKLLREYDLKRDAQVRVGH